MNYSINENLERIRGLITNRRKFSKKSFERKTLLGKRRVENIKRKASETALEAGDLVRSFSGRVGLTKIAGVGKDFFGRILKFVGFLAAGWLLNNLPTLLGYGEEFLARAQKFKDIAGNMVNAIKTTFSGMKRLLTAAFTNLMSFDFKDSEGRLEEAWQEVVKGFNDAAAEVDESVKLVTTPLIDETGRGSYSGKEIPPFGSGAPSDPAEESTSETPPPTQTETATPPPVTGKPRPKSSAGFISSLGINAAIWDTYRDTIASIETAGYSLSESYQAIGGSGGAYDGRYQMGGAAKQDAARLLGISVPSRSDFRNNPQLQEDMFLAYTYANHTYLMNGSAKYRESNPINRLQYLGYAHNQGWANAANWLATGVADTEDGFGTKGTKFTDALKRALSKYVSKPVKAQTQPLNSKVGLPPLPPTGTGDARMSMMQQYGAPRDGGSRTHAGQDYDISGNETFYSRIGGKIVKVVRSSGGGYGNYVDIYNKRLNVTERIAEGAEILPGIRVGENVSPGQPVVRGESNTGVIHYEIRPGKTKGTGDDYGFKGTIDPVGFLKSVTPVREGNKIIVVRKSQFQNMIPQSTDNGTSPIIEEDSMTAVVNRWVRELAFDKIQQ